MGIGMLLFWGLVIFGIVMLASGFGGTSSAGEAKARDNKPLDLLGERYARGEIDKSEFAQKRRDLEAAGTADKQRRELANAGEVEAS
jgi:putative membrane protein